MLSSCSPVSPSCAATSGREPTPHSTPTSSRRPLLQGQAEGQGRETGQGRGTGQGHVIGQGRSPSPSQGHGRRKGPRAYKCLRLLRLIEVNASKVQVRVDSYSYRHCYMTYFAGMLCLEASLSIFIGRIYMLPLL